MLKKTITYEDYNGNTRTEDFYFNLTQVEIAELEYGLMPGKTITESFQTLIDSRDMKTIIATIKEFLLKSYGIKSEDGKRFIKSQEIRDSFEQSPAFDQIYMSLASDADYAADFMIAIIPKEMKNSLGDNPKQNLLNKMNEVTDSN